MTFSASQTTWPGEQHATIYPSRLFLLVEAEYRRKDRADKPDFFDCIPEPFVRRLYCRNLPSTSVHPVLLRHLNVEDDTVTYYESAVRCRDSPGRDRSDTVGHIPPAS